MAEVWEEVIQPRLVGYPEESARILWGLARGIWRLLGPIRYCGWVLRFCTKALWYGDVFPVLPAKLYDEEGRSLGRMADPGEIPGRALAVMVLTGFQTMRFLTRWRWVSWPLPLIFIWAGLAGTGALQGPIGEIMLVIAKALVIPAVLVVLVAGWFGWLAARSSEFPGLRYFFYTRVLGTSGYLEPIAVEELSGRVVNWEDEGGESK